MNISLWLNRLQNWPKWKLYQQVKPWSMVGESRIYKLYDIVSDLEKRKVPGAFVECGVWKGGCAAVMAAASQKYQPARQMWLFDSFEGLPKPKPEDGEKAMKEYETNPSPATIEEVRALFDSLQLSWEPMHAVKGWFQDTLPQNASQIGPIALLRLDGDWYESTKQCLESLYDQVIPGGCVIIDDYGSWPGCKQAVDEFLASRSLKPALERIGTSGSVFFYV